jgi:spore maturation protein CgeB
MRFVMFCHSLESCWNHGNAHFLRGLVRELGQRGHEVIVYEPRDGWSRSNLVRDHGSAPLTAWRRAYPGLASRFYERDTLDLDVALAAADVVVVHEWTDPHLVADLGRHRAGGGRYRLLFHDTHHRADSDPGAIAAFDLRHYDGVLAFGRVLRDLYLARGWAARAFTFHEAADTHVFHPGARGGAREGDLVWIGNWGDDERTAELEEFLLRPVRDLRLTAAVYGVRYPEHARRALAAAGIQYRGWLPNFEVPQTFARFAVTVHVPRRPYARLLPGIPTIRPFEALACGIPLLSAPWSDSEGLFRVGTDFLMVADGDEMTARLRALLPDARARDELAAAGLATIAARHTAGHRADELLEIVRACERDEPAPAPAADPHPDHGNAQEVAAS